MQRWADRSKLSLSPFLPPSLSPQCVCISALALPVGFHVASHVSFTPLLAQTKPTMAETAPPVVSDIVAHADELYDSNKMREGLKYMMQYEYLDEVEVSESDCIMIGEQV